MDDLLIIDIVLWKYLGDEAINLAAAAVALKIIKSEGGEVEALACHRKMNRSITVLTTITTTMTMKNGLSGHPLRCSARRITGHAIQHDIADLNRCPMVIHIKCIFPFTCCRHTYFA